MLRRRDASHVERYEEAGSYPQIDLGPDQHGSYLAMTLKPRSGSARIMSRSEESATISMVTSLPGLEKTSSETLADGVLFRAECPPGEVGLATEDFVRRCHVRSDGSVTIKLPIDTNTLTYQIVRCLSNTFGLSRWTTARLGVSSQVVGTFSFATAQASTALGRSPLKGYGKVDLDFDLWEDEFWECLTEPLVYAYRCCKVPMDIEEVRDTLKTYWERECRRSAFEDGPE